MSNKDLILVTGASGKTGRKIVHALAARGLPVRAFIRNRAIEAEMISLGASEVVIGDLFDDDSLSAAVKGCAQVVHICPPMNPNEAALAKTITDLCRHNNVNRLILWSVLHPLLDDVRHHNLKLEAERYLVNSGQPYTILQPSRYMQHLVPIWDVVIKTGIHAMPFSIEQKFSLADLNDLAEAAAIVASEPGHEGATYQLAGPENLSQRDMARIISEVIAKEIVAEKKSEQEFRKTAESAGMPQARIDQICKMNAHYDKHGLVGNSNILKWLLNRPPTDFAGFIRRDLAVKQK